MFVLIQELLIFYSVNLIWYEKSNVNNVRTIRCLCGCVVIYSVLHNVLGGEILVDLVFSVVCGIVLLTLTFSSKRCTHFITSSHLFALVIYSNTYVVWFGQLLRATPLPLETLYRIIRRVWLCLSYTSTSFNTSVFLDHTFLCNCSGKV